MLTAGIIVMVASVLVGVIALTLVTLMSSAARSAGRRTRTAMALSDPEDDAPDYDPAAEGGAYYPEDAPYESGEEDADSYPAELYAPTLAAEVEQAPRWIFALAVLSGAGLVLGLLLVMIASIP